MFYKEKFIDGVLMYRNTPKDEWHIVHTGTAAIANKLFELSEEERIKVFSYFCNHCGSDDPGCYCMDDI